MMDKVGQGGVGEGSQCLIGCPSLAQKYVLVEKLFHQGNKLGPQVSGQDVPGSNEQLFPQVGDLMRTDGQEGEHPLHHQVGVVAHLRLVDPDDVSQEAQCFDQKLNYYNPHLMRY